MARCIFVALLLGSTMLAWSQDAPVQPAPPADPRTLLSSAAKYYDFSSIDLKPWHVKATYRLFDLKGNSTAQGTWEHWWVSPKMYRSTWTRPGAERTDWRDAEGIVHRKESGEQLKYFERTIAQNLISPLSAEMLMDPARMKLDLKKLPAGAGQLACVGATLQWIVDGKPQAPSSAMPSYYCFDSATLALRMTNSNSVATEFSRIVKTQGKYVAEDMEIFVGKVKAFSLSVEKIDGISASDTALTPPPDAVRVDEPITQPPPAEARANQVTTGSLVKKTQPVYPPAAKFSHIQGTVVLAATIGRDGKISGLEVLGSPDLLLTQSALDSVKGWEYKPYLLNGAPVEVESVINVYYTLSP